MTAIQGVVPQQGANRKLPPGVVLEGPLVAAKFRDCADYAGLAPASANAVVEIVHAFEKQTSIERLMQLVAGKTA